MFMLNESLRFLDHHFRHLDVTRRRLVECRTDDLAINRTRHVGDFFRTFIDQQNDEIDFRMIGRDRMRYVLHDHSLTGPRLGNDQSALTFAEQRSPDDTAGIVTRLALAIIFHFQINVLFRIKRRQIIEVDADGGHYRVHRN